jgi:hypothetical protein
MSVVKKFENSVKREEDIIEKKKLTHKEPQRMIFFILSIILMILIILILISIKRRRTKLQVRSEPTTIDLSGHQYRSYLKSMSKEHQSVDDVALLGFDPSNNETLNRFAPLKLQTACVFARSSVLWGAPEWSESLTLEQNATRIRPALTLFMRLAKGRALDAFVIELRGAQYTRDAAAFGRAVFFMLRALCDLESKQCGCMRRGPERIGEYGWWFDCANDFCFVTTFAPFYESKHSRHAYGAGGDTAGWIVLQPEFAFARRNISCGHEPTEWHAPRSARDRVRVAFLERGQNYVWRDGVDEPGDEFARRHTRAAHERGADLVHGPTAWQIVKDTTNGGIQSCLPWWEQEGATFES